MRYASIRKMDIANGEGIACSLFLQGCTHHCKGCFNPETWDFCGGKGWDENIEKKFIELCQSTHINCVSILGGEPFDQGEDIYLLLKKLKEQVGKPIYVWSGYTYEQLLQMNHSKKCFEEQLVDVLIDGEFKEELRDLRLKLRGSSNQRIIRF